MAINLSGWYLDGTNYFYSSGSFDIALGGTIPAGGYFVLAENNRVFKQNVTISQTSTSLSLSNSYESLYLISPADSLVDTANYTGDDLAGRNSFAKLRQHGALLSSGLDRSLPMVLARGLHMQILLPPAFWTNVETRFMARPAGRIGLRR